MTPLITEVSTSSSVMRPRFATTDPSVAATTSMMGPSRPLALRRTRGSMSRAVTHAAITTAAKIR
jgi:hypothetical protein